MSERIRNYDCEVIAGPCSIDPKNIQEVYKIAEIYTSDGSGGQQLAIHGARVVGLKSRTNDNPTGEGMGIDYHVINKVVQTGKKNGEVPPSVIMAEEFTRRTGLLVATEIMLPGIQLPFYENRIPRGKFMAWTPAVDQLGWPVKQTAAFARRNGWRVGIKNGKWLGEELSVAESPDYSGTTSMEKTWLGLGTYASEINGGLVYIHRGVDVPGGNGHRNPPVHETVRRVKRTLPKALIFFDPSHSNGPKPESKIIESTVNAMRMENGNDWLYDGVLVEAGTSVTDTDQHISISGLKTLVDELSTFRRLRAPERPQRIRGVFNPVF